MRKKVVVIGGGSGSFNILKGLKKYALRAKDDESIEISVIVTMMDSGGSSGIIRDEHGILPPGDVRRCLIALSDETEVMKQLFQYRFGDNLKNHNFGNLFLTALTEILGSEDKAMEEVQKMLKVNGKVVPVTLDNSHLCAELDDGKVLKGEAQIDKGKKDRSKIKRVYLMPNAKANPKAIIALEEADAIIIGPGDLYTSIIPNLIVEGITGAINESKALKIYNCNIMTKNGETDGYSVKDHFEKISDLVKIDLVTYSTTKFSSEVLEEYDKENAKPVENDLNNNTIGLDVATTPTIRHDSDKMAKALMEIIFSK